ncbi:MAG TPA: excinuclease ABC subunit UvrC [bacterium]|nr:excinuclease ABC subunit UvrC [bacterium]HPN43282.1 excinuclease ABC subunit UvrC [bacterium]
MLLFTGKNFKRAMADLQEKLDNLPKKPGVYIFRDKAGEIIYIGKAKILRNRVRSYFQESRTPDAKTARLVKRIHDLETIITDSEMEALILEANLVKENKPRYNINLKDDKSFPYIRVTNEPYPRIFPTRKMVRDGSRYFGPYTDVYSLRTTLKSIKRIFPVRSCNYNLSDDLIQKGKFKICLDYHIKRCHGPCEGLVSQTEYNRVIENAAKFIQGRTAQVEEDMTAQIKKLAAELKFEQAARLRDQLKSFEMFKQQQKVLDQSLTDRDLIALARQDNDACCVIFKVRDGKITGRQHFYLDNVLDEPVGSIMNTFIKLYYIKADFVPREIVVQVVIDDREIMTDWLAQKRGDRVELVIPENNDRAKLLEMCAKNAGLLLDELMLQKHKVRDFIAGSVKALQDALNLAVAPKRIEGFDISNIQGTNPVASMVCFINGKAAKGEYRRFKIRVKETPDDFAMMHEAVFRRYSRLQKENKPMPDLILIDGGKGQLGAATSALEKLAIKDQQIISLAKRLDEVFIPGIPEAQNIRRDSAALKLLQRVRDESHRFAITFHRSLRDKQTLSSVLEQIPGVGAGRREQLLKSLGSAKLVKSASVEELTTVPGISGKLAQQIYDYFHPGENTPAKQ